LLVVDEVDHVPLELDLARATLHAYSKELSSKHMQPPHCGLENLGHRRARSLVSLDRDRVDRLGHQAACVAEPMTIEIGAWQD
jgi:hypothetical protein